MSSNYLPSNIIGVLIRDEDKEIYKAIKETIEQGEKLLMISPSLLKETKQKETNNEENTNR